MGKRIFFKGISDEQLLTNILDVLEGSKGCRIWKRALNTDGYPTMAGNVKVHRLVYKLVHQKDITGLVVRHTCDNPRCLNPDHLIIGSNLDNVRDRVERGRCYRIVTPEIISKVKSLSGQPQKDIAEQVGIDPRRVSDILLNKYTDDGHFIRH